MSAFPTAYTKVLFVVAGLWCFGDGFPLLFVPAQGLPSLCLFRAPTVVQQAFLQFSGFTLVLLGLGQMLAAWYPATFASMLMFTGLLIVYAWGLSTWYSNLGLPDPGLPLASATDLLLAMGVFKALRSMSSSIKQAK
jgi:hypothetical protein